MFKYKWGETPKLTQSNYDQWRPDMELFLGAEEALLIVIEAEEYPEDGDNTEVNSWNKRIAKAAAMINVACHISTKPYIRHLTNARSMWKTLAEKLDTTASRAGRCSLLRQFHALRPTSLSKSPFRVTEYINQLSEYRNCLEGSEQAISDETFIAHLTTTLPESFKNIVDIILHQPAQEQTLTKVISTLVEWELSEESRRSAHESNQTTSSQSPIASSTPISRALYTRSKLRTSSHQRYHSFHSHVRPSFARTRGRVTTSSGRFRPRGSHYGFGRENINEGLNQRQCWYCGRKGHIQKDCFRRTRGRSQMDSAAFPDRSGGYRGSGWSAIQIAAN